MISSKPIVARDTTQADVLSAAVVVVRRRGPGRPRERTEPASREAQRFAAAILEVLAGVRTPTDAAAAMGISVPRYYVFEQRALAGLVAACEPQAAAKGVGPRWRIAMLEKEVTRLKQDCARQQALVRASQRTIGLAPPPAASKPVTKANSKHPGKKRRKRRPVIRALKAAAALHTASAAVEGEDSSLTALPAVLQQTDVNQPSLPASSSPVAATAASG